MTFPVIEIEVNIDWNNQHDADRQDDSRQDVAYPGVEAFPPGCGRGTFRPRLGIRMEFWANMIDFVGVHGMNMMNLIMMPVAGMSAKIFSGEDWIESDHERIRPCAPPWPQGIGSADLTDHLDERGALRSTSNIWERCAPSKFSERRSPTLSSMRANATLILSKKFATA